MAQGKAVAVCHRCEGVFRARPGAKINRRPSERAQLEMAGEKISVEVSEKHAANLETVARSRLDINAHITPRVDDDRGPAAEITDEIRRVRQTLQIKLFENHRSKK